MPCSLNKGSGPGRSVTMPGRWEGAAACQGLFHRAAVYSSSGDTPTPMAHWIVMQTKKARWCLWKYCAYKSCRAMFRVDSLVKGICPARDTGWNLPDLETSHTPWVSCPGVLSLCSRAHAPQPEKPLQGEAHTLPFSAAEKKAISMARTQHSQDKCAKVHGTLHR